MGTRSAKPIRGPSTEVEKAVGMTSLQSRRKVRAASSACGQH